LSRRIDTGSVISNWRSVSSNPDRERRPAGQKVIERRPESVHVTEGPGLAAARVCLLRRHVTWRAEHLACDGQSDVDGDLFCEAEVGDVRLVARIDEYVRRFEVPVHDAVLMRVLDRQGERADVLRGTPGRQRSVARDVGEGPAGHVVHREVVLSLLAAHLVDGDDVRVMESRRSRGFAGNRVTNSSLAKRPVSSILTATIRPRLF
jgi:hypothetical protein